MTNFIYPEVCVSIEESKTIVSLEEKNEKNKQTL